MNKEKILKKINTENKILDDETADDAKDKMLWVRLPDALNERFVYQSKRLFLSGGTLARLAIVRFIEEEETRERALKEAKVNLS